MHECDPPGVLVWARLYPNAYPHGRELISWANAQATPILALDVPSGLDATTGVAGAHTIQATATMTLALPKAGLLDAPDAGELYLADISVPPIVYQRMGIVVPQLFGESALLRVGS